MEKIRKLKTIIFVSFYVSLYLPIYNFQFLGASISANVFDIGSPMMIHLPVLLASVFGFLAVQFFVRLEKIADIVGLVIMATALLFYGIGIDTGQSFGLQFYVIILCLVLLALVKFLPDVVIKGYDFIAGFWDKLVQTLRQEPRLQEVEEPEVLDYSDVEEQPEEKQ